MVPPEYTGELTSEAITPWLNETFMPWATERGAASVAVSEAGMSIPQGSPEFGVAGALVVAVGDCGCDGGIFGESYASCGRVANVIPVDVTVPGCPPPPIAILRGILQAVKRQPAVARGQRR